MKINNTPNEIYLQIGDEVDDETIDFKDLCDVTWADCQVWKSDLKYISSRTHAETLAELERVKKERDELKDFAWQVCPLHRADDLEQLLTPKE